MPNEGRQKLAIVPITFRKATAFISMYHRHHRPPVGSKFCVGVVDESGLLRGVATCGRPVARHYDDGLTIEVNRTCTDGCPNANSALYAACWRISQAMGYQRIVTYIQNGESGASLKACGFYKVRDLQPRGSWAESSVKLKHIRDKIGSGGIQRELWEAKAS